MNHDASHGCDAQINTLHRLKDLYTLNGFSTLHEDDVNEQYKLSIDALMEEKKFLSYLEAECWPTYMSIIRTNLLRTTSMDDEVKLNRGNDLSIMASLRSTLQRYDPRLADRQDERQRRKIE